MWISLCRQLQTGTCMVAATLLERKSFEGSGYRVVANYLLQWRFCAFVDP
jgi:hypothetical protein